MHDLEWVLDAACGYGQWTYPLAELNKNVIGVEVDESRIHATRDILENMDVSNVNLEQGDIEDLDLPHEKFDGIFCYSALMFTDYPKTLRGFYNLLKPGGHLYFSTNDIGWYFYNILNEHNQSKDFSPSEMGMNAIYNSIKYFSGSGHERGEMIVRPREQVIQELNEIGFIVDQVGGDGKIDVLGEGGGVPFFDEFYRGFPMIYEVLCKKL